MLHRIPLWAAGPLLFVGLAAADTTSGGDWFFYLLATALTLGLTVPKLAHEVRLWRGH